MQKLTRTQKKIWILCLAMFAAGLICNIRNTPEISRVTNVYMIGQATMLSGVLIIWSITLRNRITQKGIRICLVSISYLLLLWFWFRCVKYYIAQVGSPLSRYCWYCYYIAMLFVPVFSMLTAFSIGRPDSYRLSGRYYVPFAVSALFLLLVLTNDLHQLIFRFPDNGMPYSDLHYHYGAGYYMMWGWILLSTVVALVLMLRKCRLPNSNKILWLPILPVLALFGYCLLYVSGLGGRLVFRDLTIVVSFFIVLAYESAISVGLIRSNSNYRGLFRMSSVAAQSLDEELQVAASARYAVTQPEEIRRTAVQEGSTLVDNRKISAAPIPGGYVLWQEDVSGLVAAIAELAEMDSELEENHLILEEEYETKHRRQSLIEKNQLYDRMRSRTDAKTGLLSALLEKLKQTDHPEEMRAISARMAVITAYIKRRSNLVFIAEENQKIPAAELAYCLRESLNNLRLFQVECDMSVQLDEMLTVEGAASIYDAFETVIEAVMENLRELYVSVSLFGSTPMLGISIVTDKNPAECLGREFRVVQEDDSEWTVEYQCPEKENVIL